MGEPYGPRSESMPPSRIITSLERAAIDAVLEEHRSFWQLEVREAAR